jgi:peroxiredoxin
MKRQSLLLVLACSALLTAHAAAQPFRLGGSPANPPTSTLATPDDARANAVAPAFTLPEFPPGVFSDGAQYRLNDLHGKTIVLFFFDPTDDRAAATLSQRNAVVRQFRDKPVAFFGVQGGSIGSVRAAARVSGLAMPVFADTLGVMAARYNVTLTPARSWHVVIINGQGAIAHEELTIAAVEKTLDTARWDFRSAGGSAGYDARLTPALAALESGQYDQAGRMIAAVVDSPDRKVSASAQQLQVAVYGRAQQWKDEADRLRPRHPIAAYDLYTRVASTCPGTGLARAVAEPLKQLEAVRDVADELSARGMYDVLCTAISGDDQVLRSDAAAYCREIIRAYPATPTAERLVKYLEDLGKAHDRNGGAPRRRHA